MRTNQRGGQSNLYTDGGRINEGGGGGGQSNLRTEGGRINEGDQSNLRTEGGQINEGRPIYTKTLPL